MVSVEMGYYIFDCLTKAHLDKVNAVNCQRPPVSWWSEFSQGQWGFFLRLKRSDVLIAFQNDDDDDDGFSQAHSRRHHLKAACVTWMLNFSQNILWPLNTSTEVVTNNLSALLMPLPRGYICLFLITWPIKSNIIMTEGTCLNSLF